MPQTPEGLSPRSTRRGRPRTTTNRDDPCARCGRDIPRLAARWPEGRLCFTCYNTAIHTHGTCPICHQKRLLPGPATTDGNPICGPCAGIDADFHCHYCGTEDGHYRGNRCARCVLREDLHTLLGGPPSNPTVVGLVDALCAADRPESLITWKRSTKVQALLAGLGDGSVPCTHEGLDAVGCRPAEHLRALLQHHGLLPPRDAYLPRFEQWISTKLDGLPDEVRQPVYHFATWHHLRRIRDKADAEQPTRGPIQSAKQEITETINFLTWLHTTYGRTAATCTQPDIDEWIAAGASTRTSIRTFFVVANKTRLNSSVTVPYRAARNTPSLTQDQRIAWIHELLTGTSEALPYRVAGTLLLLYARPITKIVTLKVADITNQPESMTIALGTHPTDVPEPFAGLLRTHLATRPNLRTGAGNDNPWLLPGTLAGQHLHPVTVRNRLRDLGINIQGARNRALAELVLECPPSLVADALGYSHQVAFRHAGKEAETWSRYVGRSLPRPTETP